MHYEDWDGDEGEVTIRCNYCHKYYECYKRGSQYIGLANRCNQCGEPL